MNGKCYRWKDVKVEYRERIEFIFVNNDEPLLTNNDSK